MNKTTMTIKIDKDLKDQAQKTAKQMGIPLSTLINAYLRNVTATGKVEFSVVEEMTPQMEKLIEEAQREIDRGETYGPFNIDEAIEFLDKNS